MDDIQEARKRGRKSRGTRMSVSVRPSPELKAVYEEHAAAMGIPLSSWIMLNLNSHLGLPVPSYVYDDLQVAAEREENEEARRQLDELPGMGELLRQVS